MLAFLLALFLNLPHLFAQSPNYNIGDVITNPDGSKGVVFWLAPDGSGGWMCALNDVSGTYKWSTQNVNISGFPALPAPTTYTWQANATVTADTAGYSHTQRLRAAGNATTYPAAYAVDFAHGWYLPAIGQLLKLYAQQATISAVLAANGGSEISRTNHYWSSTYATTSNAYYLNNPYGRRLTTSKSTAYYVRPVRSFSARAMVYDTTLTYQWSTGATTPYAQVSPSASSTYTVTATSGFGCSNTAEVSVVVANGSSQTLYDTICAGSGGYGLNGFNLSAAQTARAGDTVCVTTLSQGACSTTVTLHLHRKAPATATITASICQGECYYLNGMELCNAGIYVQHLTAANGCDSTLTLHLTVNNPDTVRFNETVCQGEPYVGHGFNIPADSTMTPHVITETVCTPSLQTGCDSVTILTLTISSTYVVEIEDWACEGEAYEGNGFQLDADQTIGEEELSLSRTFVTINGCDSVVNLQLQIIDTALEIISITEDFCEDGMAELSAVSTLENYVWSTGEQTHSIVVSQPGTYKVTAFTDHCEATRNYTVERCKVDLYLPNAITPSKVDGLNDYFSIDPYTQQFIGDFEIWIYDRWGELVFYSADKSFKWNGEVNGILYPNTMYSYRIRYTKNLGGKFTEKGIVTVL